MIDLTYARMALVVSALAVLSALPATAQTCAGDCDGDCNVSISELIRGVGINLGNQPVEGCTALDTDSSGTVSVSELIRAVNNALSGCDPCSPAGTSTPTPTPTGAGSSPTPTGIDTTATPGTPTTTPVAETPTPTLSTGTPTMIPPTPDGGLAVLGANGTDNTTVVVTFNGVIDQPTGLDRGSYELFQKATPDAGGPEIFSVEFVRTCDGGPDAGSVCNDRAVFDAVTSGTGTCGGGAGCVVEDRTRVVLHTAPHAMVVYTARVTGVRDTAGTSIQVFGPRGDIRNERDYTGEPTETLRYCPGATAMATAQDGMCAPVRCDTVADCPAGDGCVEQILDCDGDGLTDDAEAGGWIVTVTGLGGEVTSTYLVTSNPFKVDTDADGLTDDEEMLADFTNTISDPRMSDTDGDGLDDFREVRLLRSNPSKVDTDGDSLSDSLEMANGYSPVSADTDGDSIPDGSDFGTGDPRIAALPAFEIRVGEAQVTLNYEWNFTSETRNINKLTGMETAVITDKASTSRKTVDTSMSEWFAKVTTTATASLGFPGGFGASIKVVAETGVGASGSSETTKERARETAAAHQRTRESGQELLIGETEERSVTGATLATDVTFVNVGTLDMRLNNVVVTVRTADPENPGEFLTIGQLDPPGGLTEPIELGTITTTKGPFRFSSASLGERGPEFIDELMQNPRGILFDVANFSVDTPIPGTSPTQFTPFFAKEQSIIANNTKVTIDYGGVEDRPVRSFYISANLGTVRSVRDINGDGDLDPERVYRAGISKDEPLLRPTLPEAVAVTGLTNAVDPETGGFEMIDGIANDELARKAWVVIVKDGPGASDDELARFDPDRPVDDITLRPGRQIWIVYMQDADGDLVPRRAELLFGTSDADIDSEDDGVTDFVEIYEPYTVTYEGLAMEIDSYLARSNPILGDTDGDGLSDSEERFTLLTAANNIDSDFDRLPDNDPETNDDEPGFGTDRLDADTDDDGTSDRFRCLPRTFIFEIPGIEFDFGSSSKTQFAWPDGETTLFGPDDPEFCSVTIQRPGGNVEEGFAPFPWDHQDFALLDFTGYADCAPTGGFNSDGCGLKHCFCSQPPCNVNNQNDTSFDPPGGTCSFGRPICNNRGEGDDINDTPIATFTVECQ